MKTHQFIFIATATMLSFSASVSCEEDKSSPEPIVISGELNGSGGGIIAFENEANGDYNFELWVMNADGSSQTKLTNSPGYDGSPSFSPDKKKIVFTSTRSGNAQLYIFDLDALIKGNSNPPLKKLTNSGMNYYPAWAPDNSKIAFAALNNNVFGLYTMNIDGSGITKLVDLANSSTPAWSADSKKIVFVSGVDQNQEIYVVDADGSNLKRLTNNSVSDNMPSWSPNGQKIAFSKSITSSSYDICVMISDGSNAVKLINSSGLDEFPKWSPDGLRIAFRSANQIHIMNADGSNNQTITSLRGFSVPYDWK